MWSYIPSFEFININDLIALFYYCYCLHFVSFIAMAGNIIPAIATTNAVIAGLIVLEGIKVLTGQLGAARTVSIMMEVLFSSFSLDNK